MISVESPKRRSDFGNGNGPMLMGVSWALFTLAFVIVTARIYVWAKLSHSGGWSLIWTLAAVLFGSIGLALETVAITHGLGAHVSELNPTDTVEAVKISWILQWFVVIALGFGKLIGCSFNLDLLANTQLRRRYFLLFLGVSNMAVNIAQTFILIFQCSPVQKLWASHLQGSCRLRQAGVYTGYAHGGYNALGDLVFALFPTVTVWRLQIYLPLKVGLCLLMGLGVFTSVCAAMKTYELYNATETEDVTYALSRLIIWSEIECWITIFVANVPMIWPLVNRHFGDRLRAAYESAKLKIDSRRKRDTAHYVNFSHSGNIELRDISSQAYTGRDQDREDSDDSIENVTEAVERQRETESPLALLPNDGILMKQDVNISLEGSSAKGDRLSRTTSLKKLQSDAENSWESVTVRQI